MRRPVVFIVFSLFLWLALTAGDTGASPPGEKFEFQAEVNRVMDIFINKLYNNKEVFLRELISNASDALDKIRFLMLTSDSLSKDTTDLEIRIEADPAEKTLTITDRGIGMIKEDLIANLGTVAKSGTTKFVEAAAKGAADQSIDFIGQFGVGFYSVFLVAEKVTVTTKHVNDTQYVWVSDGKSGFEVYPDPAGETLGSHGTAVKLHLKDDDAKDFLAEDTLRQVLRKYSEYTKFPMLLQTTKTIEKEVAEEVSEEDAGEKKPTDSDSDDLDIKEEDADKEKPAPKKVTETVHEWERVNTVKPLWTRPIESITEEEYHDFYKYLSKDDSAPLIYTHFEAEGSVQFKGLLYIPSVAPHDLYDKYYTDTNRAIKIYVRRVLLTEAIEKDALPQYLNFVKGVVDSEDLPINVNRDSLQKDNKVLKTIGKRVTKKVISMLEELAEKPAKVEEDEDGNKKDLPTPYETFWSQFSRSIKLGVLEDKKHKSKLEKLLRFKSLNSNNKWISLEQYVEAMPDNQKDIYYISGPDQATVEKSPMLEQLRSRGFDCLYFVDNLDEYLAGGLSEFEGKKLQSVTKEGLDLGELTAEEKELEEDIQEAFKDTLKYIADVLKERKVSKVEVSRRLEKTPAVLVSTRWGWSANMERIMRGQAMGDFEKQKYMIGGRTLEVNVAHPIIKEIKRRVENDETDDLEYICHLVLDAALIHSGFTHEDVGDFVSRIHRTVEANLGVTGQPIEQPVVPKKDRTAAATEEDKDKELFEEDEEDDKDEL